MGTHVSKAAHGHAGTDKIAYTLKFYIQDFQPDTDPQIVLSFICLCYCAVYNYANNKFTKRKETLTIPYWTGKKFTWGTKVAAFSQFQIDQIALFQKFWNQIIWI